MPDRQVNDGKQSDSKDSDANVALLAQLLSDRQLRIRFRENVDDMVRELTDDQAGRAFLRSLDHRLLEAQAETLITKRQHEVAQLLPLTWKQLAESAPSLFAAYVDESVWPEGHNRHLHDAECFGRWLAGRADSRLVRAEWSRVRFRISGSRVTIRIVRGGVLRYEIQILFRRNSGQVRERILGFG
ncbi:MAG: hypothetical protein ACKVII_20805 [Planctomycetales bacterium]|jgi:hypothetical protein